jgi:hypothetical protein
MANLGVHDVRSDVGICDMFSKLTSQLRLYLLKIQWYHGGARTSVDSGLISDDICSQWFWEASHRLPQIPLEEFNDRRWEVQLVCTTKNILFRE